MLRSCLLFLSFLFSFLAVAETDVLGPPTSTVHESWPMSASATCRIKGKTIVQQFWRQQATNGMLMIVIVVTMDGVKVGHSDILMPIGVRSHLKTPTGWKFFDLSEPEEFEKFQVALPSALGISLSDWEECKRIAR